MQFHSPCAACKVLRRRCVEQCIFSPYFPQNDPLRFLVVHKVFGASNTSKLLLEIPEHRRADAVDSLVYESNTRIRDPVYGCTGVIYALQNQVRELEEELAKAQAEISLTNMQSQNPYNFDQSHIPMEMTQQQQQPCETSGFISEDRNEPMPAFWDGNFFELEQVMDESFKFIDSQSNRYY